MRTLSTVLCLAFFVSAAATLGSAATGNSLAAGKSINYTETLISMDGTFCLGFFGGPANRSYLGMWYNRIPVPTVVWVANRLLPLPASPGSLTLLPNGTLVLTDDGASTTYWSTGMAAALRNPVARLRDDGNLVVLEDGGDVYWQSFDHPTDTLLPGMRVGFNNRTGESYAVTAWKAADDPHPGDYSWVLTSRGVPQAFALNGTAPLWRAGPWVGGRFSGVPEMKDSYLFTYSYINSPNETYFQFNVWHNSMVTRITMSPSGEVQHLQWDDGRRIWTAIWISGIDDTCDRLRACGANALCVSTRSPVCECLEGFRSNQPTGDAGSAATCNREKPLSCPRGGKDNFVLVSGAKLPDTSVATVDKGLGVEECKAACLRSCSCTAFTSSDGSGCISWFGDLNDVRTYTNSGQDLYVRVASEGQKDQRKVLITIAVLVTFVIIMVSMLICLCRRRILMRLQASRQIVEEGHREEGDQGRDFGLPLFHFSTLQQATDHFSFRNKLGEGGYGPVYMGMLHPQQSIAIKRLSNDSTQGLEQFKCEVQLVAKLQHRNLVRLLGCCIENEEKILIYEYMVNQSLDKFIFDASKGQQLDWVKRLRIIEGISQGLLYLHKYSRLTVIHRDLKASNILLDADWTPKISDFGLARIFNRNEPQANTKRIIGTYGYMPPEYAMKGLFSIKSDVYSFGVLLLEILTGKKSTSISDFGISQNLPGRAWELWRQGKALEMVDPAMGSSVPGGEFSRCVQVALLCVQENPADRPTMVDVVAMLNSDTAAGMPTPSQPAFFLVRHATDDGNANGSERDHFSSSNSVTITRVEGR